MNTVIKGRLRIVCSGGGINIFWNSSKITESVGLNVAVNTLGLWTDSTKAEWQIIEKGIDYLKVKVIFKELPLSQIWIIKIEGEYQIYWEINVEIEEWLHIDEFRIVYLVNSRYKTWINNYRQEDFPQLNNYWQDLCLDNIPTFLVGVRFPIEGNFLPPFTSESLSENENLFPLIQNPPLNINAHIIGFRKIVCEEKKNYFPGYYRLFSGKINFYEVDYLLDNKIEDLRQLHLQAIIREKKKDNKGSKRKLKVLLVNLPWEKQGQWGVRAGSRWPHIKDRSEGNYLPFPFFLAYATSLLQKNDVEAHIIDAIAQQLPEERFMERILGMNFDYLVAETSVPSFYDDLRMLEKINKAGIPIILCGPNSEIYKPQFLNEHSFIDFILYGEYEFSLLKLINYLQERKDLSGIEGLIYRRGEDAIKNAKHSPFDINLLPWPNRDQLPMEKYWDLPGNIPFPSVQMLASRGCPFGCNFCLWPQVMYQGNHYRTRDIKDVIDEMEYLVRKRGFKSVYFDDDTFNVGKVRIIKLCNEIIRRDLHNIPWAIMAKVDLMEEELLDTMRKAGLYSVKYGIESASQELVDRCGKRLDLKKAERIIRYTKSLGIKIHLTFSFGLLGETKETIKDTIDYALKLDPHSIQFSIITPFPGTTLFEELDRKGRILTKDWSLYDGHYSCVFQPDNVSSGELEEAKQYAYRIWSDYQRRKRGLRGDIKRFFNYWQNYGLEEAFKKTTSYFNYLVFHRKRFIGKI